MAVGTRSLLTLLLTHFPLPTSPPNVDLTWRVALDITQELDICV